jgi:hypothetical protein
MYSRSAVNKFDSSGDKLSVRGFWGVARDCDKCSSPFIYLISTQEAWRRSVGLKLAAPFFFPLFLFLFLPFSFCFLHFIRSSPAAQPTAERKATDKMAPDARPNYRALFHARTTVTRESIFLKIRNRSLHSALQFPSRPPIIIAYT